MTRIYRTPSAIDRGGTDTGAGVDQSTLAAFLARVDAGAATDLATLGTGASLGVGGNHSLRGVKPYTLLTPNATASAGTVAGVHAARNAAGVGGVVRITANVSGTIVMNVANQTWQLVPGVVITGLVEMQANGLTWEGGQVTGGFHMPRSPHADQGTIRNVSIFNGSFAGNGIAFEGGFSDWLISQVEITNPGSDFIRMWYDQAADPDWHNFRLEHSIMIRNAGWGTRASHGFGAQGPSMFGGGDGNNLNLFYDFVVHNCYFDNGTDVQGGFGIEVWGHETSPTTGRGGIVQYSDLRGGNDHLCSMVRSRDNWVHHNKFRLRDGAYSCYESAGPNHLRGFFEDNEVTSSAPVAGVGIYHNSSARDMTVQYNHFIGTAWIVDGCCNGGGYIVRENRMTGGASGVISGGGWAIANTLSNNGPSGAGPRP